MADVAKAASVSLQTVSNVINAPHLVRPQTRERVEAVIADTGYRPLKAAQTLRTQRSHLIAVIIPEPGQWKGELHNAFLHALTRRAQKSGYRTLLFTAADDDEEIRAYDQLLTDYTLDAFVLTGTHSADRRTSWLRRKRVPFVTFGRPWGAVATHPWVDVDGAHGECVATEHLIAADHRRIAFLGWPEDSDVGEDRKAGWERACQAAGLAIDGLCARLEDDLTLGREACAGLLGLAEPPTAFVCVSDTIALGAWTEITSRGLVPGRDVAVIGFDDSAAAAAVGLTSVAQPLDEVADACLVALDRLLSPKSASSQGTAGKRGARPRVLLEPQLVIRSSSPSPEKRTP
jgi:DNA-binding LacI/PurR family transcriptional regulator